VHFKGCVSIEGWDVVQISISLGGFDCIDFDMLALSKIVCIAAVVESVLSTTTIFAVVEVVVVVVLIFPCDVEAVDCALLLLLLLLLVNTVFVVVVVVVVASVLCRFDGLLF
jgi:hypothetical protein